MSKPVSVTQCCSKCQTELPLTFEYFRRQSKTKTGFKKVCRPCDDRYQRNRYMKNRPQMIAQAQAYKQRKAS